MQYVVYGFTSVLVSNAVASCVLDYAAALSRRSLSAVVILPAVNLVGLPTSTRILLGPGIPILTEDAGDDVLETDDQVFVTDIVHRTEILLAGS